MFSEHFERVYFCGFLLTRTVTHTPKCSERDRECQTGSFAFLSGFFVAFSVQICYSLKRQENNPAWKYLK